VTHTLPKERALSSARAPDAAAPPHPAPRIVTIAKRPSEWSGMERNIVLFMKMSSRALTYFLEAFKNENDAIVEFVLVVDTATSLKMLV
jgi:hypothetical protein